MIETPTPFFIVVPAVGSTWAFEAEVASKAVTPSTYSRQNAQTTRSQAIAGSGVHSGMKRKYFDGSATAIPTSGVFLPAAGLRGCNSGSYDDRGLKGEYWSSSVYNDSAHFLRFLESSATMTYGKTVRTGALCVASKNSSACQVQSQACLSYAKGAILIGLRGFSPELGYGRALEKQSKSSREGKNALFEF